MYDHLKEQKETIKSEIFSFILPVIAVIILIAITPVSVTLLFEAKEKYINLLGILEVGLVLICAVYVLIRLIMLIRFLVVIRKAKAARECTGEIICINAKPIMSSLYRRQSAVRRVIGFILKDGTGKKYYCILPNEKVVHFDIYSFVRTKCIGQQFTIKYYKGTNLLVEPPFTLYDYDLR